MKFMIFILVIGLTHVTLTSALFLPSIVAPTCMPFGKWNRTTNMCDCPPGKKGDGSLCCVDDADDLCTEKGDPVAASVYHQKFWTDFPCAYELGTVQEPFADARVCKISVIVAGRIVDKGAIYNNHFMLKIKTKGLGNSAEHTQRIKLWGKYFHDPQNNKDVDAQAAGQKSFLFDGHQVICGYSPATRVWTINGCGASITLRGFKGEGAVQKETPGVCIAAKRNQFEGDVCTKGQDYTPGQFGSQSERLLRDFIMDRSSNNNRDVEDADIQHVCDDIASDFKKCSADEQPFAIRTCGKILLTGLRRRCVTAERGNPLGIFKDCVSAVCGKARSACNRLKGNSGVKKCLRSAAIGCDSWVANPPKER